MFNDYDSSGKLTTIPVSASDIAKLLRERKIDRVVLSSCKTASTDVGAHASLCKYFLERGMTFVLGMSYNTPDSMLGIFCRSFYREILVGRNELTEAASIARRELRRNPSRWSYTHREPVSMQDWFIPVVYSNGTSWYSDNSQDLGSDTAALQLSLWPFIKIVFVLLVCDYISKDRILYCTRWGLAAFNQDDGIANYLEQSLIIRLFFILPIFWIFWEVWTQWRIWRFRKFLDSIDHDRGNILRVEGDLKNNQKIFVCTQNDVEKTAQKLFTTMPEIWCRTHLVKRHATIKADWFIQHFRRDDHRQLKPGLILQSIGHALWLLAYSWIPTIRCWATSSNPVDTVIIIENVDILFPEWEETQQYHRDAQDRFYDWIERHFGSLEQITTNVEKASCYLVLLGEVLGDTQVWFDDKFGNCDALRSTRLTEYTNPKEFSHNLERGVLPSRSGI